MKKEGSKPWTKAEWSAWHVEHEDPKKALENIVSAQAH